MKRIAICLIVASIGLIANECIAGNLPGALNVGGTRVALNGAGSRYKNFIQLYEAGLYTPRKTSNAAAVIASDSPMAIRIKVTSIFVTQSTLTSALNQGFANSTGGNTAPISSEIKQFQNSISDAIAKGDVIDIAYVPGRGTYVIKNGTTKSVVKGLAFKKAVFGIWLCDKPADAGLRTAMLNN